MSGRAFTDSSTLANFPVRSFSLRLLKVDLASIDPAKHAITVKLQFVQPLISSWRLLHQRCCELWDYKGGKSCLSSTWELREVVVHSAGSSIATPAYIPGAANPAVWLAFGSNADSRNFLATACA